MRIRLLAVVVCAVAFGCTTRPPPIKSAPTASDPAGPPECTMADGIDQRGNPSCSEGCSWSVALKRCAPEENAPAKDPRIPPNGV